VGDGFVEDEGDEDGVAVGVGERDAADAFGQSDETVVSAAAPWQTH